MIGMRGVTQIGAEIRWVPNDAGGAEILSPFRRREDSGMRASGRCGRARGNGRLHDDPIGRMRTMTREMKQDYKNDPDMPIVLEKGRYKDGVLRIMKSSS
jgi:hypothetical protein